MSDPQFLQINYKLVNGINTRYADMGKGESIIFVHGFPETLQTWRFVVPEMAKRFRAIAFDMKGCGYTDKPESDYSPLGLADFINDFMTTMQIERTHIVGTDTGLAAVCAFAAKYPQKVNKMIIMAGSVFRDGITPEIRLLGIKNVSEVLLKYFGLMVLRLELKTCFYNKNVLTKSVLEEYLAPFKSPATRHSTVEIIRCFFQAAPSLSKAITTINAPTLILWAAHERFFAREIASRLQKAIKNSRLEIISDCGHFVQEEKPEDVIRLVSSFILER